MRIAVRAVGPAKAGTNKEHMVCGGCELVSTQKDDLKMFMKAASLPVVNIFVRKLEKCLK